MKEYERIWNNPLQPLWLGAEQIEKMCNESNRSKEEAPMEKLLRRGAKEPTRQDVL